MVTTIAFIFWCPKITLDSACRRELKRHLLLGRTVMTNLDSILKSRDITLPQRSVESKLCFSCKHVWIWELDLKAEGQRINAFELWCWRRPMNVPLTERKSYQSILSEVNTEYSLEGLMLKLKFQYFGILMRRDEFLEKTWCWEEWGQEEKWSTED